MSQHYHDIIYLAEVYDNQENAGPAKATNHDATNSIKNAVRFNVEVSLTECERASRPA